MADSKFEMAEAQPKLPISDRKRKWPEWVTKANEGDPLKLRVFKPVVPRPLVPGKKRGGVRVLKIYNRFARVDPELKKWPAIEGYERFNVCKNTRWGNGLSPMALGPVHVDGELFAHNIEDGWQCIKVWPHQQKGDSWKKNWDEWSLRGRFSGMAKRHRRPNPGTTIKAGESNNAPLFSVFRNEELDYVRARKRTYVQWYRDLVVNTDAYKDLKNAHLSGVNLLLLEYDGLGRDGEHDRDLDEATLVELINDRSRAFGHGLCLASVLLDADRVFEIDD